MWLVAYESCALLTYTVSVVYVTNHPGQLSLSSLRGR